MLIISTSSFAHSSEISAGAGPPIVREPKPRASRTPIIPGDELVGGRDLPIYAAAMGGEGHMIVTFEAIDWVKRPAVLQNVRGGYGILVRGESMIPAYWPGDTALVNPHLQPARDSDAVFFHTPPKERCDEEAIIKRLVGMNDCEWTLEQYRPAKTFTESRVDWPICHRVSGEVQCSVNRSELPREHQIPEQKPGRSNERQLQ
ncbi:S24 family peptidase [Mesorhizobium sp. M2E.F.Ca.ET.209.01.1.1]|uniref:S24 family peptidase n=1 Tax=Mesorhizobium sp. M2E.F.Ca.ET.209.01.1.1 TaxID=2500526 RepID=UPI001FED6317|nr:S24 family peptidase [Mesorhizobium sp. M2E.F.Ca.ET.209.01.1.1]